MPSLLDADRQNMLSFQDRERLLPQIGYFGGSCKTSAKRRLRIAGTALALKAP
jgi:hypothetical protein